MIKVKIDYSDGNYSATPIDHLDSITLDDSLYCVVDIQEDKLLEWENFLLKLAEWNNYWRNLNNEWFEKNYSK